MHRISTDSLAPRREAPMDHQISRNVRYLLWRKAVPRERWGLWLLGRTSLTRHAVTGLVRGETDDTSIPVEELRELARALDVDEEGESLRYSDLAAEGVNVLVENLRFLFDSLGRGGKKVVAIELGVDPTTISRWLCASCEPHPGSMHQLVAYFGLPAGTDLREDTVFLSAEPVSLTEQKKWVHDRVLSLGAKEFRELYPALRRMLEER